MQLYQMAKVERPKLKQRHEMYQLCWNGMTTVQWMMLWARFLDVESSEASIEREQLHEDDAVPYYAHLWNLLGINWIWKSTNWGFLDILLLLYYGLLISTIMRYKATTTSTDSVASMKFHDPINFFIFKVVLHNSCGIAQVQISSVGTVIVNLRISVLIKFVKNESIANIK